MIHRDDRDKWIPFYTNRLALGSGSYIDYLGGIAFGAGEGDQSERIDVFDSEKLDAYHYVIWSPDFDEHTPGHDLTLDDYVVGSSAADVWDEIVKMTYEGDSNAWQFVHHYLADPEPWISALMMKAAVRKLARRLDGTQ